MIDPKRYPAEVFFSDEDEGFVALARDLPGCSAFGDTREEALAELEHAIEAWQRAAEAAGNPVPEPSKPTVDPLPSGKILLRTPRSLHAALIETAKKESVSLNQHLVAVLSADTASRSAIAAISQQIEKFVAHSLVFTPTFFFQDIGGGVFFEQARNNLDVWMDFSYSQTKRTAVSLPLRTMIAGPKRTVGHAHG